jgi:hypothetical protein
MHVLKVLHKVICKSAGNVHATRLSAIHAGVKSLLNGSFLTVTALGRGLQSPALVKHNIKRMDRLLSNRHLQQERQGIYQSLCHYLCATQSRPVILVDWTDIVDRERLTLIRAALAVEGRAITLYEAVYPLKHYNTPHTHKQFLNELKILLPAGCRPIVVTDTGFRGPWFKAVEALGWDWIGRIRNCVNYRLLSRLKWRYSQDLYYRASSKVKYLGAAELSSKRPYHCHLYLYKKPRQGRVENRSIVHTIRHSHSRYFRKQQKDPWLLATNLTPEELGAQAIIRLYSKRMQIEECFRDLKSDRFGFGLALSRSKRIDRLNNLLLLAALATLCLWWIGYAARAKQWQRHFQANTVRHTHVLSVPFLALAVIRRQDYRLSVTELIQARNQLLIFINEKNNV